MAKQDRVKLIAALVILLAAGLLFAWYFGVFDSVTGGAPVTLPPGPSEPPPPPPTPSGQPPSAG